MMVVHVNIMLIILITSIINLAVYLKITVLMISNVTIPNTCNNVSNNNNTIGYNPLRNSDGCLVSCDDAGNIKDKTKHNNRMNNDTIYYNPSCKSEGCLEHNNRGVR